MTYDTLLLLVAEANAECARWGRIAADETKRMDYRRMAIDSLRIFENRARMFNEALIAKLRQEALIAKLKEDLDQGASTYTLDDE